MSGRWQERLQNYKKSVEILNETIQCIGQNGLNKIYTILKKTENYFIKMHPDYKKVL